MFQFPTTGNHTVFDHYYAHRCRKCGTAE